jgi:30S ribosomal protein S31
VQIRNQAKEPPGGGGERWPGCIEPDPWGLPRWLFPGQAPRLRTAFFRQLEHLFMGKGDIKSRRGKIYRGSFGKSRPKDPDDKKKAAAVKALKK